jgi:hypothetical protein
MDIGPVQRNSVTISCVIAIASSALLWLLTTGLGKPASIRLLVPAPAATVVMLLYVKNMTVRLDDRGISRGLFVFHTFIPYERIVGVSREIRQHRGGPTTYYLISERNTATQIVLPFYSYDQTELARMMTVLARMAPQIQIDAAQYIQLAR